MRVLVGCERSGAVRRAFRARGHDAWSCDLVPADDGDKHHYVCDVRELLDRPFDAAIFFPDCTYVAGSGLHWNARRPERVAKTAAGIAFALDLWRCRIPRVALENPVGLLPRYLGKWSQVVQPWQFGDDASKATCLWLRGLPLLRPTNILPGGRAARRANQTGSGQNRLGPSPERARLRGVTYPGLAAAFAAQWGGVPDPYP